MPPPITVKRKRLGMRKARCDPAESAAAVDSVLDAEAEADGR